MLFSELVDIKENYIYDFNNELLNILLKDMTSNKNIIWGTDNYISRGYAYSHNNEIKVEQITGRSGLVIRPRIKKSKIEQGKRIREKAEVFTPSWVCNKQNNLLDSHWFCRDDVFNKETSTGWVSNKNKVEFSNEKTWEDYVNLIRLEVACGEAPYLVSRYDTTTGDVLEVYDRIGLLDRKLRIINENVCDEAEWYNHVKNAYKSIYGYEWQGDSLLIARENLLYTFADNYKYKWDKKPTPEQVFEIANIISWNIFQMDGMRFVIPNSCKNQKTVQYTLFGDDEIEELCPGCKNNNCKTHNGVYVKIMNWKTNRKIKFVSLIKRSSFK